LKTQLGLRRVEELPDKVSKTIGYDERSSDKNNCSIVVETQMVGFLTFAEATY